VLLVTGREIKVGGAPPGLGRVAVVETLDVVERALTVSRPSAAAPRTARGRPRAGG